MEPKGYHRNLNHLAVNHVLEEALVIPINSPPYRAPCNGAIEHSQGEFKSYLDRWSWKAGTVDRMMLLPETAAHDLNHQPRRCMGGKTACRAYFGGPRICYRRRKREAVYRFIQELAAEVSTRAGKPVITPTACRVAAKQWLLKNRLIRIQREMCHPIFIRKWIIISDVAHMGGPRCGLGGDKLPLTNYTKTGRRPSVHW